jgi:hypothetical protein
LLQLSFRGSAATGGPVWTNVKIRQNRPHAFPAAVKYWRG